MSIRHDLETALRPLLPEDWRIIPYERDIDPPSVTTVMIRQHRLRYENTLGRLLSILQITVVSANTDNSMNAEDDLDDGVNAMLDALLNVAQVRIPTGEKTRYGKNGYPAWNIDVEALIERKI